MECLLTILLSLGNTKIEVQTAKKWSNEDIY